MRRLSVQKSTNRNASVSLFPGAANILVVRRASPEASAVVDATVSVLTTSSIVDPGGALRTITVCACAVQASMALSVAASVSTRPDLVIHTPPGKQKKSPRVRASFPSPRASNDEHSISSEAGARALRLLQRRLDLLRVVAVRDEGRADLDQQRLQLGVARIGDQRLVERIQHLLVIRHLVVDVCLVEGRAFQRFQVRQVLLAAGFEALAGWVVLGLHFQLGDEIGRLLVHA